MVFVPETHYNYKFCIRDLSRDVDPESIVATLASDTFKPYLVSHLLTGNTTRRLTLASPTPPADIVFAIQVSGALQNVLLEQLISPVGNSAKRAGEGSPSRKAVRVGSGGPPGGAEMRDVQGGGPRARASMHRLRIFLL